MNATATATISRSKAKSHATDIRRAASGLTNMLDTVAAHPEWADERRGQVDHSLNSSLRAIEDAVAALREGLGLRR